MANGVDILFVAHGSKSLGMGHLSRCSKIEHYIRTKTNGKIKTLFLGHFDDYGEKGAKENGLNYIKIKNQEDIQELENNIKKIQPKVIVNDNWILNPPEYYSMLKKLSKLLIVIDDSLNAKDFADILINVDPNKYMDKPKRKDLVFLQGVKYLLLPYEINEFRYDITGDILVFFGGTDFRGMAVEVAKMISDKLKGKKITVVGAPQKKLSKNITVVENFTYPVTSLLKFHNIVVTSGGTAMLESIYFKKPTFAFAAQPWEKQNIKYFEERSLVKYIGSFEYYPEYIVENFLNYLKSPLHFDFNFNLIDGLGIDRICKVVLKRMHEIEKIK